MRPIMRAGILITTIAVVICHGSTGSRSTLAHASAALETAKAWTVIPVPPDFQGRTYQYRLLYRSVFSSAQDGWVFGEGVPKREGSFDAFALRWNGQVWQQVAVPQAASPPDASGSTPGNIWVALRRWECAEAGPAMRFDGTSWTVPPSAAAGCPSFVSIRAFASDDVWAVGYDSDSAGATFFSPPPVASRFDGSRWNPISLAELGNPTRLTALGGSASNDVWIMGTGAGGAVIAAHWNGSRWSLPPTRVSAGVSFHKVLALASNDVWAVGSIEGDVSLLMHWDGTDWSSEIVSYGQVTDVASNAGTLIAVGERSDGNASNPPFVLRRVGDDWVGLSAPVFGYVMLYGISAIPGGTSFLISGTQRSLAGQEQPFLATYDPSLEPPAMHEEGGARPPPPVPLPPAPPPPGPASIASAAAARAPAAPAVLGLHDFSGSRRRSRRAPPVSARRCLGGPALPASRLTAGIPASSNRCPQPGWKRRPRAVPSGVMCVSPSRSFRPRPPKGGSCGNGERDGPVHDPGRGGATIMNRNRRWALDTLVVGLGLSMATFFGAACLLGQRAATAGSELVSVAVLEKLVDEGRRCQTVTDEEILAHMPRRHC